MPELDSTPDVVLCTLCYRDSQVCVCRPTPVGDNVVEGSGVETPAASVSNSLLAEVFSAPDLSPSPVGEVEEEDSAEAERAAKLSRSRLKNDQMLRDPQSTGRKRAARYFPLDFDAPCEWQGQANCGGGTTPIVGCHEGLQQARHHGPDKSVTNNEVGNVHRICHSCHNRWHAANNSDYDWNSTLVNAHAPRPMTDTEKLEALVRSNSGETYKEIKD